MAEQTDILIVGGGLVGTSLALALDAAGRRATLLEAAPRRQAASTRAPSGSDNDRNLALARASVNGLMALSVWPRLEAAAGTIRSVEVSRAGEFGRFRMSAEDLGVEALGRVVPGRVLAAALEERLAACRNLVRMAPAKLEKLEPLRGDGGRADGGSRARANPIPAGPLVGRAPLQSRRDATADAGDAPANGAAPAHPTATSAALEGWRATIRGSDGLREIDARLVVGADGSDSLVRSEVGIGAQAHDYRQSLFVCTVSCEREAPDRAFERFTDAGPVALLPLPKRRRGLVLTVSANRHDEVAALDDAAFLALAQARFGWKLGRLSRPGKRFPHRIRRVLADASTAPRAVLIGNAAQTVHPIGAQGFNLGLRDAMTLAELITAAADPGAARALREYAARRKPDREGVLAFSHGLIELGCLPQPALAPLRSLALMALGGIKPLRRGVTRRGMGFRGRPPAAVLDVGP